MNLISSNAFIKDTMTIDDHKNSMSGYPYSYKAPTDKIYADFGDLIKYTWSILMVYEFVDNKLLSYSRTSTGYSFATYESVSSFLKNNKYLIYFVNANISGGNWLIYAHIQNNIPNLRNNKIEQLGIY